MQFFRRIPWQLIVCFMRSLQVHNTPRANPILQESPSRLSEPAEVIVPDLKDFIPDYMHQQKIPGVGIAFIRNGAMVWEEGFGVTNTFIRRPVTTETLFEVASNSKVVTASIALRLVDQGVLSLDRPLNRYLTESWLPSSEYRDVISLRHVLSHSSGLGHNTTSLPARCGGARYRGAGLFFEQRMVTDWNIYRTAAGRSRSRAPAGWRPVYRCQIQEAHLNYC